MPIYILQKDTVVSKAGDEFNSEKCIRMDGQVYDENDYYYVNSITHENFTKHDVENNSEWFKLKEESVKVLDIINDGYTATSLQQHHLQVTLNRFIPCSQLPKVKEAIERLLNEDIITEKMFTLRQMEDCWCISQNSLKATCPLTFERFIEQANEIESKAKYI